MKPYTQKRTMSQFGYFGKKSNDIVSAVDKDNEFSMRDHSNESKNNSNQEIQLQIVRTSTVLEPKMRNAIEFSINVEQLHEADQNEKNNNDKDILSK